MNKKTSYGEYLRACYRCNKLFYTKSKVRKTICIKCFKANKGNTTNFIRYKDGKE